MLLVWFWLNLDTLFTGRHRVYFCDLLHIFMSSWFFYTVVCGRVILFSKPVMYHIHLSHLSRLLLMETWISSTFLSTVNTALKISPWDPVDSVVRYCRLNWWFYFKHLKCLHPALYRGRTIYSPQNVQGSTLCEFYQHNILFCLIVAITMMCRWYLPEVLLCKYQMFSGPKSKSKFIEYLYKCFLDICLSYLRKCPPKSFICYFIF